MNASGLLQTALNAGCLALAGLVLFVITARMPRLLLTLFLAQITLTSGAIGFYPSAVVSGVHIYLSDVFTVLLMVVGVSRKLHWRNWVRQDTLFTAFASLVIVGFLFSIPVFSLQSSINQTRQLFLSIAAYFWASSLGKWNESLLEPFIWVALVGATAQNFLYLRNGFGSASDGYYDQALGGWVSARPLEASGALILLCGFLVILSRSGQWTSSRFLMVIYLGLSVVLSQHRSVWIAALVSLLVLSAVAVKGSRTGVFALLPGLAAAIPIGLVAFLAVTNSSALINSAESSQTLDARFSIWSDRLAVDRSLLEWLTGGFVGPTPVQLDPSFQFEAHSMYVQTLNTVGFVGLTILLATLVSVFPGFADAQRRTQSFMLIAVGVFGFFYTWPAWTFLLLGMSWGFREPADGRSISNQQHQVRKRATRVSIAA